MHIIPGRQRQEYPEFETSLHYIRRLYLKKKKPKRIISNANILFVEVEVRFPQTGLVEGLKQ
jgi:hypothetical protein